MRREGCSLVSPLALMVVLGYMAMAEAAWTVPPTKLTWHYYRLNTTCKYAEVYIRSQVQLYWNKYKDRSIAPKLLRLLYSDCFVTVCVSSELFFSFFLLFYFFFQFLVCISFLLVAKFQPLQIKLHRYFFYRYGFGLYMMLMRVPPCLLSRVVMHRSCWMDRTQRKQPSRIRGLEGLP